MLVILSISVLFALVAPTLQGAPAFDLAFRNFLQRDGINENTPTGTVIGQLNCTDPDGDKVVYFVEKSKSLSVQYETGYVTLEQELDREGTSNQAASDTAGSDGAQTARFICQDLPTNGLSTEVAMDVTITVIDFNDNAPEFVNTQADGYTFYVKEDAPVNTVLSGTISIRDKDLNVNANLKSLTLICDAGDPGPCETFSLRYRGAGLGKFTANIILDKKVDYETREVYIAKLVAIDAPRQPVQLTSSIGIRIQVNDSQDTNPLFVNVDYTIDIYEELSVGSVINFNLSARDGDGGDQRPIKLEVLQDVLNGNLFTVGPSVLVDPKTGVYSAALIVAGRIDRDLGGSVYTFRAEATELNKGMETDAKVQTVFTVNVRDLNDNYPVFQQNNYTVSVPETSSSSDYFQIPNLRIEVNDYDEFFNSRYEVQIYSQSFSGAFQVNPSRQVSGLQIFTLTVNNFQYMDYDTANYRNQEVQLRALEVMEDGSRKISPSNATVYITLKDINDNSPAFKAETYEAAISENAANFTSIVTVMATDRDGGDNGRITYSLSAEVRNQFYINTVTGTIRLFRKLDYETVNEYSFIVYAEDHSSKPKTAAAVVIIRVIDYNDRGPSSNNLCTRLVCQKAAQCLKVLCGWK